MMSRYPLGPRAHRYVHKDKQYRFGEGAQKDERGGRGNRGDRRKTRLCQMNPELRKERGYSADTIGLFGEYGP